MLDLLRQFEEQQKELEEIQQAGLADEEEGPEAQKRQKERKELEERIAGLDLGVHTLGILRKHSQLTRSLADALPPEQLLSFLTPEQQAAFEATLQDPNRVNKLVEEEFEGDEPWWVVEQEAKLLKEMLEASRQAEEGETLSAEDEDDETNMQEKGRPPLLSTDKLPALKVGPDGKALANPNLLFNVVAVLCVQRIQQVGTPLTLVLLADLPTPSHSAPFPSRLSLRSPSGHQSARQRFKPSRSSCPSLSSARRRHLAVSTKPSSRSQRGNRRCARIPPRPVSHAQIRSTGHVASTRCSLAARRRPALAACAHCLHLLLFRLAARITRSRSRSRRRF